MECFIQLWSHVSAALRADGRQLAICVDDSNPAPFSLNATSWSYETAWLFYLPFADVLVNMGTYPGSWSAGRSFPAAQFLKPYPCASNASRLCGVEGQIDDMLRIGAHAPSGQLQAGLWMGPCAPNGTTTQQGWTEEALGDFLGYLALRDVRAVAVWTDDALLLPSSFSTCDWFVPTLRAWVANDTVAVV